MGTTEGFPEHVLGVFNSGMRALMIAVGRRTDLVDVMGTLAPTRSSQIADAAGLNERYV